MAYSDEPNRKNLRERADYGVRVARPGYDANNCAQNQLLFNSGWPILQITKVVDLSKLVAETKYRVRIVVQWEDIYDPLSGGVLSDTITEEDAPPAGYTKTYTRDDPTPSVDEGLMVNKKYVRRDFGGRTTGYNYPVQIWTEGNIRYIKTTECHGINFGRIQHRLGYTPLFIASEHISGTSGYVVLFSVDITKDVDYPYTEEPMAFLSGTKDYGIKSSSIFGSRVPGLCSDMFSKLVQAVKTQDTSPDRVDGSKTAVWSPVKSWEDGYNGVLAPYEFYGFGSLYNDDGGNYYFKTGLWAINFHATDEDTYWLDYTWAMASYGGQSGSPNVNTLVVLRSPMVSPEYEERTIS